MKNTREALCELILASDFYESDLHDVFSYEKISNQMVESAALRFLGVDNVVVIHELFKSDFFLQAQSERSPLAVGWRETEICVPYVYEFYGTISFSRESLVSFFVDLVFNCEKPLIIDNIFLRNQVSYASFSIHEVVEIAFVSDDTELSEGSIYWKNETSRIP